MVNPDQKEMFDVLQQQRDAQQRVDRILKVVLPVTAFLLAMICANMTISSTLGTLLMMLVAFWMVGIRRQNVAYWATSVVVYCFIDHLYTFSGDFNINIFARHCGTMMVFLWIIGLGRPYIDRWYMSSQNKLF
jgi:hypothetical protein